MRNAREKRARYHLVIAWELAHVIAHGEVGESDLRTDLAKGEAGEVELAKGCGVRLLCLFYINIPVTPVRPDERVRVTG
jgi:hypothetical protein